MYSQHETKNGLAASSQHSGRKRLLAQAAVAALMMALGSVATAHHSYAMFDRTREVKVEGTIVQFQLVNPHSWLDVMAQDANGTAQQWSFEGGTPAQLTWRGLKASMLKPGDKVTVEAYPLKDGRPGGHIVRIITSSGKVFETVPGGSGLPGDKQ